MRTLYLDLDGVMADFDAHFPAVFGLDHRERPDGSRLEDARMWALINEHPSFFRDMPPCPGALEFFAQLTGMLAPMGVHLAILTACAKEPFYASTARQKRAWVRHHLGPHVRVLPVLGGRNKPLFMHNEGDLLIDDWEKNVLAWREAGGRAILHRSFAQTWAELLEGEG